MTIVNYFIGAVVGIIVMIFLGKRSKQYLPKDNLSFKYRQSHIFEIVKPLLPPLDPIVKRRSTQAYAYEEKTNVKIIIIDGNAYWIKDNEFYTAEFTDEGIDPESTSKVDIMGMDKIQLDKMLFIMDQLREGKGNDSRSSGN